MSGLVLRENFGPIAVLTLNRPEKLNALSPDLFLDLREHVDAIAGEQTRCVVLRGAGPSFSAGADIDALKAGVVTADRELRSETIERLGQLPQAVIAAVHGHCYTGALELALAADIIIAADNTKFCDTHAKLGIVPRWGMSARLPRRVGLAMAKRLSFTAEAIAAQEALRIGLCDEVVPLQHLQDAAMRCAEKIAGNATSSIAAIKHLYQHNLGLTLADALEHERQYTRSTTLTESAPTNR